MSRNRLDLIANLNSLNSCFSRVGLASFESVYIPHIIILYVQDSWLNALILTIWTVHAPMQWTVVFDRSTDAFGRPLTSYGLCSSRSNLDTVYLWILGCCNIAILLVFNYLAYRLSGVQTENYEHEYISLAYISGLEVFVVGMPFLASKLVIPRTSATRPHFI